MNKDVKKLWHKLIIALSSFGLLSTFGYYLINLENQALGKRAQTPSSIEKSNTQKELAKKDIKASVVQVVDGDTIKVRTAEGKNVTVRMIGIDTPETSHSPRAKVRGVADCFANEATNALKSMLQGNSLLWSECLIQCDRLTLCLKGRAGDHHYDIVNCKQGVLLAK